MIRPFTLWSSASACLALILLGSGETSAQTIRGTVVDDRTGTPIVGVSVMLVDADEAIAVGVLTDSLGSFILSAPRTGRYAVTCERIGYQAVRSSPIDLLPPDTIEVSLRMSVEAVLLAPLEIKGGRDALVIDTRLARWGYYDRRALYGMSLGTGIASFLDYDAIQKRNPSRVSSLLQDQPGIRVLTSGTRGVCIRGTRGCGLTFFLDGVRLRISTLEGIDAWVLPSHLAAVEVYPRAPYPAQYAPYGRDCGSIVIWTGWVEGKGKGGGG